MKLRLMGTPAEVEQAGPVLERAFDVVDVSPAFPCLPPSRLVRVYLEVRLAHDQAGER